MKKILLSVAAATTLLFTSFSIGAQASTVGTEANQNATSVVNVNSVSDYTYETVEQVSTSKATAKKGSFKLKHNTNVRTDAGTKNRIVTTAKKGAVATATHQKKVGKAVWYKVKVNGKSGWVLSTLLTTSKAPVKKTVAAKEAKASGSYKVKHNSNVRSNAGTKNRIVTSAKKGTTVTTSAQKKVGNTTWYKIKANGKTGWISGTLLTKTTAKAATPAKKSAVTKTSNSTATSNLINNAKALQGIRYKFGGTTTNGFDCSGFIQYAFNKSGQSMARDTLGQFAGTKATSTPQPGDLVFFAGTYRPGISHVGIYLGNNQFIHTSTSRGVAINNINDAYWKDHFHSIRR